MGRATDTGGAGGLRGITRWWGSDEEGEDLVQLSSQSLNLQGQCWPDCSLIIFNYSLLIIHRVAVEGVFIEALVVIVSGERLGADGWLGGPGFLYCGWCVDWWQVWWSPRCQEVGSCAHVETHNHMGHTTREGRGETLGVTSEAVTRTTIFWHNSNTLVVAHTYLHMPWLRHSPCALLVPEELRPVCPVLDMDMCLCLCAEWVKMTLRISCC